MDDEEEHDDGFLEALKGSISTDWEGWENEKAIQDEEASGI